MSMTPQHFEAIANTLAAIQPDAPRKYTTNAARAAERLRYDAAHSQWAYTVREMARTLAQFNEGFSLERFYKACGLED